MYIAHKTCINCDNAHFVQRKFFDQVRLWKEIFISDGQISIHITKTTTTPHLKSLNTKKIMTQLGTVIKMWQSQTDYWDLNRPSFLVWQVLHTKNQKVYSFITINNWKDHGYSITGMCNIHYRNNTKYNKQNSLHKKWLTQVCKTDNLTIHNYCYFIIQGWNYCDITIK